MLCLALGLHIFDEATTGFLAVYNPTVVALRQQLGWWPMPTFGFTEWLVGLIAACAILLILTGPVSRGAAWTRPVAYAFAIIMLLNAGGHTLATILRPHRRQRDLSTPCTRILVIPGHGGSCDLSAV
jgi:hypothetical protein